MAHPVVSMKCQARIVFGPGVPIYCNAAEGWYCEAIWRNETDRPFHQCPRIECDAHMRVCKRCEKKVCSECAISARRVYTPKTPDSSTGRRRPNISRCDVCPTVACSDCSVACVRCSRIVCAEHGTTVTGIYLGVPKKIEVCNNCVLPTEMDEAADGRGTPFASANVMRFRLLLV